MQISVADLLNDFSETSFFWTSSKNAYRLNASRMGTEQHRTNTERERERVWNGNRTRSVKRSLLGFFYLVPYKNDSLLC